MKFQCIQQIIFEFQYIQQIIKNDVVNGILSTNKDGLAHIKLVLLMWKFWDY